MKRELIETVLSEYTSISLMEMAEVRLMNRVDTKYTTSFSLLPEFLKRLRADYYVQEINGSRISPYRTMYLDTYNREMYLDHHNGRRTREKIRVRVYVDSQATFLEIKNKNNKGRTKKKRIPLSGMQSYSHKEAEQFIDEHAKYSLGELMPRLENSFYRTTLVNRKKTERLTIDVNLAFRNPSEGIEKHLNDLVIIELKQDGNLPSFAKKQLSELHIHPVSISKYCLGTILTVPDIKSNRFKKKMIQLNKIRKEKYGFV
jgi:hypothetical protein